MSDLLRSFELRQRRFLLRLPLVLLLAFFGSATAWGFLPPLPWGINVGGARYWDPGSGFWDTDLAYLQTTNSVPEVVTDLIPSTARPTLYQTGRWAYSPLRFRIPVVPVQYCVRLKFAELRYSGPGQRLFHVFVNGQQVLSNFDIFAAAGGKLRPVDFTTAPFIALNGEIKIEVVNVRGGPMLNAIEILPVPDYPGPGSSLGIVPLGAATEDVPDEGLAHVHWGGSIQMEARIGVFPFSVTHALAGNQLVQWSVATPGFTISPQGLLTAPAQSMGGMPCSYGQCRVPITATLISDVNQSITTYVSVDGNQARNKRVNAGGGAFLDSFGHLWSADVGFQGGIPYTLAASVPMGLGASIDQNLYRTERWLSSQPLVYRLAVPNGVYFFKLLFAENYYDGPGKRWFHIDINGTRVRTNFDTFAAARGKYQPTHVRDRVEVTNGEVVIRLTPTRGEAHIHGIQIGEIEGPVQWLDFPTADPDLPGDGQTYTSDGLPGPRVYGSSLNLEAADDGFTITVFGQPGLSQVTVEPKITPGIPPPCVKSFDNTFPVSSQTTTFNGVTGYVTPIPRGFVDVWVAFANSNPQCPTLTKSDLVITNLGFAGFPTVTIDAVAVGFGQNNIP